jgi:ubiquinone/menaquinone biosynthesis C-methylase UbiE
MVTVNRWLQAQEYEQMFWANLAGEIDAGIRKQLTWYQWKASELEKRIEKCGDVRQNKHGRILEVGSGPIGIVNFLEWGDRFAIDPLEDFYSQNSTLTTLRKPEVSYTKGTAEHLPYPDSFFSLVVIDNVIDHTHAPVRALEEIHRVLEHKGLLYLTVNVRTAWGAMIHKWLATFRIDKGHPHTFTNEDIRKLLTAQLFHMRMEVSEDYRAVKEKFCQSKKMKERIKGYTGIAEFLYHVVCQKASRTE